MITRDSVVEFLDTYLSVHEIHDGSWNGLQVEGNKSVHRILFAVDAGIETFECAVREKTDMVVVHHGHFWKKVNPSLRGWSKKRLSILLQHNISLYACHLPLDMHPEVGNNARLLSVVGAGMTGGFFEYDKETIGKKGRFGKSRTIDYVVKKLEKQLNTTCTVLPFGPSAIRTIGAISGGGGYGALEDALKHNLDCYITGDSVEIYHNARDAGIHVVFAGHHATETLGVKALAGVVKKQLKVQTLFIDIPTGL